MLATYGFVNFCGMRTLLEGVRGMWASCEREVESLAILTTEQGMRQSRCPGIASKLQPGASVQEEGSWLSSPSLTAIGSFVLDCCKITTVDSLIPTIIHYL